MERIRRGDIWTVSLPAFPKPRPALIVSIDPINDLRPDILVIPITTHAAPLRVPLPNEPGVTGLRELRYATCESAGPLHKSHLKARIGRLPADAWPAIEAGLARTLGLRTPTDRRFSALPDERRKPRAPRAP